MPESSQQTIESIADALASKYRSHVVEELSRKPDFYGMIGYEGHFKGRKLHVGEPTLRGSDKFKLTT